MARRNPASSLRRPPSSTVARELPRRTAGPGAGPRALFGPLLSILDRYRPILGPIPGRVKPAAGPPGATSRPACPVCRRAPSGRILIVAPPGLVAAGGAVNAFDATITQFV